MHQYIIHVEETEAIELIKYLLHQCSDIHWSLCQSKRHYEKFVLAKYGGKSTLLSRFGQCLIGKYLPLQSQVIINLESCKCDNISSILAISMKAITPNDIPPSTVVS